MQLFKVKELLVKGKLVLGEVKDICKLSDYEACPYLR